MEEKKKIDVSVRNLVEFIMRSGNLDNRGSYQKDMDTMRQGTKLHSKIQKSMASNYNSEVALRFSKEIERDDIKFEICVEGRADGVVLPSMALSTSKSYVTIKKENYKEEISEKFLDEYEKIVDFDKEETNFYITENRKITIIDEIKCVLRDVENINEMVIFHRAQVMCYAYIYACKNDLKFIAIRLTYCNIENENMKYFGEVFSIDVLEKWYENLLKEYAKWAVYEIKWKELRDCTLRKLEFPFEYREGQKKLAQDVYRTIMRDKRLYIEAPTGVGKTVSTVFPTVKAMGENLVEKIFYLTAKTITRTAAEDIFKILKEHDAKIKVITITAKDKICILEKSDCNPVSCERAKGHFDRVNDAVYDMIMNEYDITREVILEYAEKYKVCPFEMSLDISLWVDVIICDYNYIFDPNVYLRRFFEDEAKKKYVFLVDEAHNLVERAEKMYSATLIKDSFLKAKTYLKKISLKMTSSLDKCNKELLKLKRKCDDFEVIYDFGDIGCLIIELMRLVSNFEKFFKDFTEYEGKEEILNLYFEIRNFINVYDCIDDDYLIYTDYTEKDEFRITLQCMNPSRNIEEKLKLGKSTIMFSATFLPIRYYMEQLAGRKDDYAIYVPSPFDVSKRLIMIANDVSTRYSRRTESEYKKITTYIEKFVKCKMGNYMVFFPSYAFMEKIYNNIGEELQNNIVLQENGMNEVEKEQFLEEFQKNPSVTKIGFCVLGGSFSEGIDLKNDRLEGVVVVGTGLPMVCAERELFKEYYNDCGKNGFDYAYRYNGMNKVLQAGGRVIRTMEDVGTILLLDERFLNRENLNLFPREWYPYEVVNSDTMLEKLKKFYSQNSKKII